MESRSPTSQASTLLTEPHCEHFQWNLGQIKLEIFFRHLQLSGEILTVWLAELCKISHTVLSGGIIIAQFVVGIYKTVILTFQESKAINTQRWLTCCSSSSHVIFVLTHPKYWCTSCVFPLKWYHSLLMIFSYLPFYVTSLILYVIYTMHQQSDHTFPYTV